MVAACPGQRERVHRLQGAAQPPPGGLLHLSAGATDHDQCGRLRLGHGGQLRGAEDHPPLTTAQTPTRHLLLIIRHSLRG